MNQLVNEIWSASSTDRIASSNDGPYIYCISILLSLIVIRLWFCHELSMYSIVEIFLLHLFIRAVVDLSMKFCNSYFFIFYPASVLYMKYAPDNGQHLNRLLQQQLCNTALETISKIEVMIFIKQSILRPVRTLY